MKFKYEWMTVTVEVLILEVDFLEYTLIELKSYILGEYVLETWNLAYMLLYILVLFFVLFQIRVLLIRTFFDNWNSLWCYLRTQGNCFLSRLLKSWKPFWRWFKFSISGRLRVLNHFHKLLRIKLVIVFISRFIQELPQSIIIVDNWTNWSLQSICYLAMTLNFYLRNIFWLFDERYSRLDVILLRSLFQFISHQVYNEWDIPEFKEVVYILVWLNEFILYLYVQ